MRLCMIDAQPRQWRGIPMVEEIKADQLDLIVGSSKLVFVDCMAVWCHPCKTLGPMLEELDEKYKERGFKVVKIDVDRNRDFSMKNEISSVPSVFVYSEGKRVIFDDGRGKRMDRLVGVMPQEVYTEIIENLLSLPA
ncbi:MAG: hypothetical protein C4K49_09150 [Candidatus Thorarchaeota archaeon]|nr:MAG: hypothetical protein C4K49_09150 [Candidatus Thorarchaeota archaeon]